MTSVVDLSRPPSSLCLHACALTLLLYLKYPFEEKTTDLASVFAVLQGRYSQISCSNDASYSCSPLLHCVCGFVLWCDCVGERLRGCVYFSVLFYNSIRDRQVNCWLELVVACVRLFVGGCDLASLLVQPHPVCDTLR